MDKSLRLRLVVQRNGVPDVRILFNVPLGNEPTIAQLLEQINDTVPLEDARGEWGIDDYVVELHDKAGHAFECLHFQPVATVLDRDDEVFIRPLSTLDLKKRRLAGRDQILSGGEHLIDGVPFGRHRLRVNRGRPAVHIAPRKRRRLNYDQNHDVDDLDDYFNQDDDMDEYTEPRPQHPDEDEEEPLLITQFGHSSSRPSTRRVRFPANTASGGELGKSEESADENSAADDDDDDDDDDEEGTFRPDSQELSDELRALVEEEEEYQEQSPSEADRHERFHTPNEDVEEHTQEQDASSLGGENRIKYGTRSARQTRSYGSQEPATLPSEVTTHSSTSSLDSLLLDKIMAIRSAFPQVSSGDCQKFLIKHGKDVSKTWKTLEKSLTPRQGLAETMVLSTQLELPKEVRIVSSPVRELAGHLGEVSRIYEDEESHLPSEDGDESDGSASSSDEQDDSDESDGESSSEIPPTRPSPLAKKLVHESSSSSSSSEDSSSASESESQSDDDKIAPRKVNENVRREQKPARKVSSYDEFDESSSSSDSSSDSSNDSSNDSSSDSDEPFPRQRNNRSKRRNIVRSSQSSPVSSKALKDSSQGVSAMAKKGSFVSKTISSVGSNKHEGEGSQAKAKATTKPSATVTTKTASQRKPDSVSTSQTSNLASVPPGKGKTRTQKRNQRRRLESQRKKAALEAASSGYQGSQDSAILDALLAKKNALLQTLGSQSQEVGDALRDASPINEILGNVEPPSKGPDDWKQKISYRAVECVQEGVVDISEPPFPFYQRWDPQLRQDSQGTSKWRNKRKARDSSQFYSLSSQPSHKKRKEDEHSHQVVDEYSYQEDTTTFLANQDDVTLNYDDVTFNADTDNFSVKEKEDTDDLPQLPKDLSSLPELLLKDLAAGAIVAWKQLLCTEATNWQPQLSGYMTAVIVEADSVKGHLHVQLAKRDRDVEKNEKKFDEETGQRIYGKFEVPDEDEEDEDQGFRDLVLSQMMDARLVQPAEQPHKDQSAGEVEEDQASNEPNSGDNSEQAHQVSELDFEVADSQPKQNSNGALGMSSTDPNQSRTLDHESQSHKDQQGQDESQDLEAGDANPSGPVDESFISDTNHDIQMGDEYDDSANSVRLADQLSISDERREEISQLIKAEGFRPEVRSSVEYSSFLRLGSPSRQLEEEYASSLHHKASSQEASTREASSGPPSEYDSKNPSQQMNQQSVDVDADAFHSAPQTPQIQLLGTDAPESQQSGKPRPSTERAEFSQSTEVSARSGRQPDHNLIAHSDELGAELATESPGMMTFEDDNNIAPLENLNSPEKQADRAQTPTQKTFNDDLQTVSATKAAASRLNILAHASSPHGSVSSSSSSESFPDIEVLWSRMASQKFKESPIEIKNEPSSQIKMPSSAENSAQPVPQASTQQDTKENLWSSPARSTRSSVKSKGNHSTSSTPKDRSKMRTFDEPISPPALPKFRQQKSKSSPSPASTSKKAKTSQGKSIKTSESQFSIPEGSQVISLMTSSPAPEEPDDEPEYTEMYAEDSVDDDYRGDSYNSQQHALQKKTGRSSKSSTTTSTRAKRGASVPIAENNEATVSSTWVPGSQGPSRKATGRFGGRWSIGL